MASSQRNDEVPGHLKTIFDPSTLVRKGLCPVTKIRNQGDPFESHSLYFEQHGTGPEKILFIMGLNSTSFAWSSQVLHFARSPQYSVLVFDNRGVGNSGAPKGPYTTSAMAEDAILLLDYIGWTAKRDLHVVGISLGGMICQELATRIPDRIVSLTLCVTTPGGSPWKNFPPRKGAYTLTRLMTIKDPNVKVPMIVDMLFPGHWLDAKAIDDPAGRTNREVQIEKYLYRIEFTQPQTFVGALSQMSAALTHHMSDARLRSISYFIPKVLLLTGDDDNLVNPRNSKYIKDQMPEAELVEWTGFGHALNGQDPDRFNELLERVFREGREKLATAATLKAQGPAIVPTTESL